VLPVTQLRRRNHTAGVTVPAPRTHNHSLHATAAGTTHSLRGCTPPQSKHCVPGNWAVQYGHTAWLWNVSNGWPHCPHFQSAPIGGAVLHLGQANPSRRGNFSNRHKARACRSPLQQFMSMKTARTPNQTEPTQKARPMNPATPTKPRIVAAIRLRARPTTNHSRDRRI
jgi:hypothetical protein